MQFTAQQIAALINGKIEGNPEATIHNIAKIEEAQEGALSFIANPKYEEYLYKGNASIVIVNDTLELSRGVKATLIRVKDAYMSFASLLEKYKKLTSGRDKTGVEQPSYVSTTAKLGANVYIAPFCYVGENVTIKENVKIFPGCYIGNNVVIKKNTVLHSGVRIYNDCVIGEEVTLHAGVIIGGDGFGFAPLKDGTYKKVPQMGNVVVEDKVEIGANTTIDRATLGSTYIRKGVKLDNLIQIAHNVEIGENTVIAAQTGVSGSTKIGKNCIIGGQVGIVGHIQIADGTRINAQSGLSKSITENNLALNGSPAFDYKSSLKSQAIFRNLPDLNQRIQKLEELVLQLQSQIAENISSSK